MNARICVEGLRGLCDGCPRMHAGNRMQAAAEYVRKAHTDEVCISYYGGSECAADCAFLHIRPPLGRPSDVPPAPREPSKAPFKPFVAELYRARLLSPDDPAVDALAARYCKWFFVMTGSDAGGITGLVPILECLRIVTADSDLTRWPGIVRHKARLYRDLCRLGYEQDSARTRERKHRPKIVINSDTRRAAS